MGVLTGDGADPPPAEAGVCTPTGPVAAGVEVPPNENPILAAGVVAEAEVDDDEGSDDLDASCVFVAEDAPPAPPKLNPPAAAAVVAGFKAPSLATDPPKLNPAVGAAAAGALEESCGCCSGSK